MEEYVSLKWDKYEALFSEADRADRLREAIALWLKVGKDLVYELCHGMTHLVSRGLRKNLGRDVLPELGMLGVMQ